MCGQMGIELTRADVLMLVSRGTRSLYLVYEEIWDEFPGTPPFYLTVQSKVGFRRTPTYTLCIHPAMHQSTNLSCRDIVRKVPSHQEHASCSVPEGTRIPARPALARPIIGSAGSGSVPFGKFGLGWGSFWPGKPTRGTAGRVPVYSWW